MTEPRFNIGTKKLIAWVLLLTLAGTLLVFLLSFAIQALNLAALRWQAPNGVTTPAPSQSAASCVPGPSHSAACFPPCLAAALPRSSGDTSSAASNLIATQAWLATLLAFTGAGLAVLHKGQEQTAKLQKEHEELLSDLKHLHDRFFKNLNTLVSHSPDVSQSVRDDAMEQVRSLHPQITQKFSRLGNTREILIVISSVAEVTARLGKLTKGGPESARLAAEWHKAITSRS